MDGSRLNLLQQEAMLADISDWILIFAESCGSFCELGAFSALPHAAWITSVAVGKQYKGSRSFLIDGPVEEISTGDSSLNKVFYLDLNNPMSSPDLCRFVSELRPLIGVNATKRGKAGLKAARKMINRDESKINVDRSSMSYLICFKYWAPCQRQIYERYTVRPKASVLESSKYTRPF